VTADPQTIPSISIPARPSAPANPSNLSASKASASTADPGPDTNPEDLTRATEELLYYSDYNCNNFLSRAFELRTNKGFFESVLGLVLSGTTTIITPISSVPELVPTSLNGGNTVIAGEKTTFESSYYANKSFDIMEAGIQTRRKTLRDRIEARLCMTELNLHKECDLPQVGSNPPLQSFCLYWHCPSLGGRYGVRPRVFDRRRAEGT